VLLEIADDVRQPLSDSLNVQDIGTVGSSVLRGGTISPAIFRNPALDTRHCVFKTARNASKPLSGWSKALKGTGGLRASVKRSVNHWVLFSIVIAVEGAAYQPFRPVDE
jgi:hypothetical protein